MDARPQPVLPLGMAETEDSASAPQKLSGSRCGYWFSIRAEALDLDLLPADLVMHRLDVITADLPQPDLLNHPSSLAD